MVPTKLCFYGKILFFYVLIKFCFQAGEPATGFIKLVCNFVKLEQNSSKAAIEREYC